MKQKAAPRSGKDAPAIDKEEWIQRLRKMPTTKIADLMELLEKKEEEEPVTYKRRDTGKKMKEKHASSQEKMKNQKEPEEVEASKAASPFSTKKVRLLSPHDDSPINRPESSEQKEEVEKQKKEKGKNADTAEPRQRRVKVKAQRYLDEEYHTDVEKKDNSENCKEKKDEMATKKKQDNSKKGNKRKISEFTEIRRSSRISMHSISKKSDKTPLVISDDEEEAESEEMENQEELQRRLREVVMNRKLILKTLEIKGERGFSNKSGELPAFISSIISQQGCEKFCEQPPVAFIETVIDFYGRLAFEQGKILILYNRYVRCSEKEINSLYGICIEGEVEGNQIINNPTEEQMKEALQLLTRKGTSWTQSTRGVKTILAAELKNEPAVWLNFIRNRICPTTHYTTVSLDKVMILYCLFKGIRINVGEIISDELKEIAKKSVGCIFFPSLITELCREAQVPIKGKTLQTKPMDLHCINTLIRLNEKKAQKAPTGISDSHAREQTEEKKEDTSAGEHLKKMSTKLCTYFKYRKQRDESMWIAFSEIFGSSSIGLPTFPVDLLESESDSNNEADNSN